MSVPRTFLIISQVFPPDPAAVGQHLADLAEELARRGHRVIVITADRGYDDPSIRYPRRERLRGAEVRRVGLSSFGKRSMLSRLAGGLLFTLQAIVLGLLRRRVDSVIVSTVPPMASLAALAIGALRRSEIAYWVMDLNPDQLVAMGVARQGSLAVRIFDRLNRAVLRRARHVVVLDRFMAERVRRKADVGARLTIIPPWPPEDHPAVPAREENAFRAELGLTDEFIVMYSGNHAASNPLGTLLDAAERLRDDPGLVFVFVGGGVGKREVEARLGPNVRSVPYQPLARLGTVLSAADVHVVSLGDAMVGIVHPCKVYGAMAVGRPILLLGPAESHVGDLLDRGGIGWRIAHGDVDGAVGTLRAIRATPSAALRTMGERAHVLVSTELSKAALRAELCDLLEGGVPAHPLRTPVRA